MSYSHHKPYIPPPPALPRFALPSEADAEEVDLQDLAPTAQLPALDRDRGRGVVRRARPASSSPEGVPCEIQPEDILLELYTEDPPPPVRRPGLSPPPLSARSAPPSHAYFASSSSGRPTRPAAHRPYDEDSPSVGPVAFPSTNVQVAAPTTPPSSSFRSLDLANGSAGAAEARRVLRNAFAIWTVALIVVGLTAAGVAVGIKDGTYARLRERANVPAHAATRLSSPSVQGGQPVAAAPAGVAPVAAAPAGVAPVAPAAPPSVTVDSLAEPTIPVDSSLATFPVSAQGHRVFFDGRPMAITGAPMKLRCGRHVIRVGGAGASRVVDLPCGRAISLAR